MTEHLLSLVRQQIHLEALLQNASSDINLREKIVELETRKNHLESCLSFIEAHNQMNVFVVLGIPASPALTSTFIGLAISFFAAIFSGYKTLSG